MENIKQISWKNFNRKKIKIHRKNIVENIADNNIGLMFTNLRDKCYFMNLNFFVFLISSNTSIWAIWYIKRRL